MSARTSTVPTLLKRLIWPASGQLGVDLVGRRWGAGRPVEARCERSRCDVARPDGEEARLAVPSTAVTFMATAVASAGIGVVQLPLAPVICWVIGLARSDRRAAGSDVDVARHECRRHGMVRSGVYTPRSPLLIAAWLIAMLPPPIEISDGRTDRGPTGTTCPSKLNVHGAISSESVPCVRRELAVARCRRVVPVPESRRWKHASDRLVGGRGGSP